MGSYDIEFISYDPTILEIIEGQVGSVFFFEFADEVIPDEFLHADVFFLSGVLEELTLLTCSADDVDVNFVSAAAEVRTGFGVELAGFFGGI